MKRDSFVFFIEWAEALRECPDGVRLEVYDAIIEYAASGIVPELKQQAKLAFGFIKGQIDRNNEKYVKLSERRRLAGQRGMESRWGKSITNDNKNNKAISVITNDNKNNYNENENENVSTEVDVEEKPSNEGKKSASASGKFLDLWQTESENENYGKFLTWALSHTPYLTKHIAPLSESQFMRLRDEYGANTVRICMENLENRKDLRRKYSDLYRTLLNWCKRERSE